MDKIELFVFGVAVLFVLIIVSTVTYSEQATINLQKHCLDTGHSVLECRTLK